MVNLNKLNFYSYLLFLLFYVFMQDNDRLEEDNDRLITYNYTKYFFKLYMNSLGQRHFYHMVRPSWTPFFAATISFQLVLSFVGYMHNYAFGLFFLKISLIQFIFVLFFWFRLVIIEGTYEGMHTKVVQKNLKNGFALFILSEIMFFFGFFWAFFYLSVAPNVEIGCIWPPKNIYPINPFKLPLLNTLILLLSGLFITLVHMFLRVRNYRIVSFNYKLTLLCGILFMKIQYYEYVNAAFTIADSVYGSTFYLLTGFHGLHVLIGAVFIFICYIRTFLGHFTSTHHVGFECAAWYWHFVDVVWLFLYFSVYLWGSWGFYF
jgi:cytochrome c oxidase subunit 3